MDITLVARPPHDLHLFSSSSNVARLPSFLKTVTKPSNFAHFWQGADCIATATNMKVQISKVLRNMPQHVVLLPFLLRTVLRATAACAF